MGTQSPIELRPHPLGVAVHYAGTILFIGGAKAALSVAEAAAKQFGTRVQHT